MIRGTPRVAVVVLNWNGPEETVACLSSLAAHDPSVERVVVDNGSTDNSVAAIRGSGLAGTLICNDENLGFAGGNNVGIQYALDAGFDVIAVLNNDTLLSRPSISRLAARVIADQEWAVSPVINYATSGQLWFAGAIVDHGFPRHLQSDEIGAAPADSSERRPAELLTGCCLVATASTWRRVGLFDGRLFLFFEDSDWSMRARAAGVRLGVDFAEEIDHIVSGSTRSYQAGLVLSYYFGRNACYFVARHAPSYLRDHVSSRLLRPLARAAIGREEPGPAVFRFLGAVGYLLRRWGPAPRWISWLAGHWPTPADGR